MCQSYRLGFALYDHQGRNSAFSIPAREGTIDYRVSPVRLAVRYREWHFHGYKGSRVLQLFHQPVEQLLTYPFLRRQAHPFLAPFAEDLLLIIMHACTQSRTETISASCL